MHTPTTHGPDLRWLCFSGVALSAIVLDCRVKVHNLNSSGQMSIHPDHLDTPLFRLVERVVLGEDIVSRVIVDQEHRLDHVTQLVVLAVLGLFV